MEYNFDDQRILRIATEVGEALEFAAMGAEPWDLPLKVFHLAFPNAYFALVNQDFLNGRINQAVSVNLESSLIDSYSNYYAYINPYKEYWDNLESGCILNSQNSIHHIDIKHTEFYNDWLHKADARTAGMGLKIDASPSDTIYLPMHCSEKYFDQYAVACNEILTRLRSPLEQAIRISRDLQRAGDAVAARAALVDHDHSPAIIVNRSMRIVETNAAAIDLLRNDAFVGARGGQLFFREKALAERITEQVKKLAASPLSQAARFGWDDGNSKWLLSLTRLPADPVQRLLAPQAQILLRLTDLKLRLLLCDLTEFTRLFRLTPAETRLAAALGNGLPLADAAISVGITFETARDRLKRIFQKTGTSKQSELCVMLTHFHYGC